MDYEMQAVIMFANHVFAAMLVINDKKIVFNTRNGSTFTTKYFRNIPRHIVCASGFLGCENAKSPLAATPYINNILSLLSEKLIIYGKHNPMIYKQLFIHVANLIQRNKGENYSD